MQQWAAHTFITYKTNSYGPPFLLFWFNGRLFNCLSADLIDPNARCIQSSFTSGCSSKIDITFSIEWSLMSLLLWHMQNSPTLPFMPYQEWQLMFNPNEQLQKHFLQHNMKSTFHNLFHFALLQGQQASSTCDPQPNLSPIFQDLYSTENLGWTQLYYGRNHPLWVTTQNQQHPNVQWSTIFIPRLLH